MENRIKQVTILLGDVAILYASLFAALLIRYQRWPSSEWENNFFPFSTIFIFWVVIFYISDLYSLHNKKLGKLFDPSVVKAVSIASGISVLYFYANSGSDITPKAILLIFIVLFFLIFSAWRRLVDWLLGSLLPKNNLMFIGYGSQVKELITFLKERPNLGFRTAVILDRDFSEEAAPGIAIIKEEGNLAKTVQEMRISTIIISKNPHFSDELRVELFSCLNLKVDIMSLPNFYETVTGKVPIEAISQVWFIENLSEGSKRWFNLGKRLFDILFSSLLLLLSTPFWPLIIAIIRIESKGNGFFMQKRSGENGCEFYILKFRTMRQENNDFSPTRGNDSRITPFGNFLRKTRLDELPQVLNILRGEMSFVGPRPERPELIEELKKDIPFYQERMLVKPGLTGWDQISGEYHSPSREDTLKKLQYDLFYIKNRSAYLDLSIILKTIAIVFSRKGM